MHQSIHLLLASVLAGVLLPVTAGGYGFAAYPGDGEYLSQTWSTGGHHYSGSMRIQTGKTGDSYYVRINLDGLRPEDIRISLQRNYLVLQISKDSQYGSHHPNDRRYSRWQVHFHRRLRLPVDADVTRMTMSTKNGIMQIKIPAYPSLKW